MVRSSLFVVLVPFLLSSCGGEKQSTESNVPPVVLPGSPVTPAPPVVVVPPPSGPVACLENISPGDSLLLTDCMTESAKQRIRNEYIARIADGTIMDLHGGFDPRHYPGEVVASVMAIAEDTHDAALMDWSINQIQTIKARLESNNGFHIWPQRIDDRPTFGELAQSRMVMSLGLIFNATGDQGAKEAALIAFDALERMPRMQVTSSLTGRSYLLPNYVYHDIQDPTAISGRTLDPNHDAGLAATYTIMARHVLSDPGAIANALDKAAAYTAAATDLAFSDRCLPLADAPEFVAACDTRYNAYWSFLLAIVANGDPNGDAMKAIDAQFIFQSEPVKAFKTDRTYPEPFVGDYPDPVEPLSLLSIIGQKLTKDEAVIFLERTDALLLSQDIEQWPRGNIYPKYFQ